MQVADSLAGNWQSNAELVELVPASRVNNGDGTETVSVRLRLATPSAAQKFVRLVLIPGP